MDTQSCVCCCAVVRACVFQVFVLAAEELSKMTDMDELLVGRCVRLLREGGGGAGLVGSSSTCLPVQLQHLACFACIAPAACTVLCVCAGLTVRLCATYVQLQSLPDHACLCTLPARRLFPAFQNIRAISKVLSAHVGQHMVEVGLGTTPPGCTNWEEYVASNMWTADQL